MSKSRDENGLPRALVLPAWVSGLDVHRHQPEGEPGLRTEGAAECARTGRQGRPEEQAQQTPWQAR